MFEDSPHSTVFWFRWEIQPREPNGRLAGKYIDHKEYRGVIHCNNVSEAKEIALHIAEILKKETENVHKTRSEQT
jgi:hypothetical protein